MHLESNKNRATSAAVLTVFLVVIILVTAKALVRNAHSMTDSIL